MKKAYVFLLVLFTVMLTAAQADVTLPEGLIEIEAEAFKNTPIAGTLTIPEGVATIGAEAFSGCDGLTELVLPDTVTRIESKAFAGCSKLAGTIVLADNCTVAEDAFDGCDGLTVEQARDTTPAEYFSYRIEDGQVTITKYLNVPGIENVVVPSVIEGYPVTSIDKGAFSGGYFGESYLRSVRVPDSVAYIGPEAFFGCVNLVDVVLSDSMTSICERTFLGCEKLVNITIPDRVTTIGREAFFGCEGLLQVSLPDKLNDLGEYAFECCIALTKIEIPDNVTCLRDGVFWGCKSMTSISLPERVTSIGIEAFAYCSALTAIRLPANVISIGQCAFAECSALTEIYLPDGVSQVGYGTFMDCTALERVALPKKIVIIGDCAFQNCKSLQEVYIPASVKQIGENNYNLCNSNIVIYGESGSYAETYAKKYLLPFKAGTLDGTPSCPYETAQGHQPPYGQLQDVELVLYDDGRIHVNAAVCSGCGAQLLNYGFLPESIQTQFYFHPLAHYYDTSANGKEYVKNSDYKSVVVNEDLTVTGDIDLNGAPLTVNGILRVEGTLSGVGKIQCSELIVESKGVLDASAATFIGADSDKALHVKTGGKMFINDRTNITCAGDLNMDGLLTVYRSGTSDETSEYKGTITLTKQNPKMKIDNEYAIVKLRVKKIVLSNTAPYCFSWGNPVFWVEENEVNAEEIKFGCEPSQEDAGKLAKKMEEWEEKRKNTSEKLSKKKEAADNALSNYNSPVNELSGYLDKVDGEMTAKADPLADFAVAGYMHPSLTLAGTNTEKEYRAAASALLSDAIRQEFLDGAGIRIPETGEVVINIIAAEGTYEGSYAGEEWILNFRQMGAGVNKEGKMVSAVCYKADDDIDDKLTPRYVIVAASTTEAVGEVLEEMARGAVKEVVQQLISLTEELFNATDGMDAIEELVVGILNWEDLTSDITTLKDYKKQLTEKIENKVFSEIRGEIGYKIDNVEAAYYTLKAVYEEYKELMEELEDYKKLLDLSQTYLK